MNYDVGNLDPCFELLPAELGFKILNYCGTPYNAKTTARFLIRRAVNYNNARIKFLKRLLETTREFEEAWLVEIQKIPLEDRTYKIVNKIKGKLFAKFEEKFKEDFFRHQGDYFCQPLQGEIYGDFVTRVEFIIKTLEQLNDHYYEKVYEFLNETTKKSNEFSLESVQRYLQVNPLEVTIPKSLTKMNLLGKIKCNFVHIVIEAKYSLHLMLLRFLFTDFFPFNFVNSYLLGDVDSGPLTVSDLFSGFIRKAPRLLPGKNRVFFENKRKIENEIDFFSYIFSSGNGTNIFEQWHAFDEFLRFGVNFCKNKIIVIDEDVCFEKNAFLLPMTNDRFDKLGLFITPDMCESNFFKYSFSCRNLILDNRSKETLHFDALKLKNVKTLERIEFVNLTPNMLDVFALSKFFKMSANIIVSYVGTKHGFQKNTFLTEFLEHAKQVKATSHELFFSELQVILVAKELGKNATKPIPVHYSGYAVPIHEFLGTRYDRFNSEIEQVSEMDEIVSAQNGMDLYFHAALIYWDRSHENSGNDAATLDFYLCFDNF